MRIRGVFTFKSLALMNVLIAGTQRQPVKWNDAIRRETLRPHPPPAQNGPFGGKGRYCAAADRLKAIRRYSDMNIISLGSSGV